MSGDEFSIYDPFARQRKKRTGSASDFDILYQQDIDKPMIARIVEAARRTERGRDNFDEVGVEAWAERIDDQARADATNATYGDKPFAPRDFAAKRGIDLAELGRKKNKRHPFQWALHGTEERDYQQANDAFGQRDYEDLMAIPERRKVPRGTDIESGFGQPPADIIVGDLGPGGPVRKLPEDGITRPFPMPTIEPPEDVWRQIQPMPIDDPPTDGGEQPPEGGHDVAPLPGRMRFPVQPVEDPGMEPIPGGPTFEHPDFGRGYPILRPVTEPRDAAEEEPPEIDPGFGQAERALLIDQLIGAIETGQISIDAVQALVKADQANKFAVQPMDPFASAEEEAFTGDGLNQFTAIDTDPRAGPAALRPDPPKPSSPLQPEDDNEETDRGGDLYKTVAGPRGYHESPYGTDYDKKPDYDLEGWDGEAWDDRRAGFFKDGVKRKLSSRWGWRYLDEENPKDFHGGIDIAAVKGTEVSSIDGGRVACNNHPDDCPGALVIINNGVFFTYLHIDPGKNFKKGDRINPGDSIGTIAAYNPPHLHYARHKAGDGNLKNRIDENSIDPLP
jgi:murein DD-endopeptidase MepM/ murein hydrolase activator NlpD